MIEQLPNEHGRITAQELVDDKLIVGEQALNGAELYWMTLNGEYGELLLPDNTEYIYAAFDSNDGFWLLWGSAPAAYRNYLGESLFSVMQLHIRLNRYLLPMQWLFIMKGRMTIILLLIASIVLRLWDR